MIKVVFAAIMAWWILKAQWAMIGGAWLTHKEGQPIFTRDSLPLWGFFALLCLILIELIGIALN